MININEYSYVNLAKLQSGAKRLFHSIYIFENYPELNFNDDIAVNLRGSIEKLDYPLGIIVFESGYNIVFALKYDNDLLDESRAQYLLSQLEFLLLQILQDISKKTFSTTIAYFRRN